MNQVSDFFDAVLFAVGIDVPSCCNGHVFFLGCVLVGLAAPLQFDRWSWGAFAAAVGFGVVGNFVRIWVLLPLAGLPCFQIVHDVTGWIVTGICFLVVVECYEPRRDVARAIGAVLVVCMLLWGVLYALVQFSPGSGFPSGKFGNNVLKANNPLGELFDRRF